MVHGTGEPGLRTNNMKKGVYIKMGRIKTALGKIIIERILMNNASYSNIISFIIHI